MMHTAASSRAWPTRPPSCWTTCCPSSPCASSRVNSCTTCSPSLWLTSCPAYLAFYQANKDFVSSLGLSHEQSLHKMRLLTLMQLAESRRELPFELLQQELQLQDVEGFVVEALRTRMLTAKIDQTGRKVIVGTTVHRTFGRHQWVQLKESLAQWHDRLGHVESSMDRVTRAHFEPLTAPPTA
ncbi:hypothetical protein MTO96_044493 [Rhipicephalus appendiculatus]